MLHLPEMYTLLLTIHILGAVLALGAPMAAPLLRRRSLMLDKQLANAGYAVLLLTGLGLIAYSGLAWTTPWILISFALYGVAGILALVGYLPGLRDQRRHAAQPESPAYLDAEERANTYSIFLSLIMVAIVYLMTVKPPLWG